MVVFIKTIGIWEKLINVIKNIFIFLTIVLPLPFFNIPVYFWIILLCVIFWLFNQSRLLKLVSGEFYDDFRSGLNNWEYGGEGWKTEFENGTPLLSVSESQDGGISKKGFSWNDYQFSFKTKIISKNSGWIIRAENRNKYIMIQLWMEKLDSPKIRLHYRVPPSSERQIQWIVAEEIAISSDKKIKILEWVDVRIAVLGSTIDIYLNNQHCAHYFIPDPIRWENKFITIAEEGRPSEKTYIDSINYPVGRIGFRCSGGAEHAHFREVRVKPLL